METEKLPHYCMCRSCTRLSVDCFCRLLETVHRSCAHGSLCSNAMYVQDAFEVSMEGIGTVGIAQPCERTSVQRKAEKAERVPAGWEPLLAQRRPPIHHPHHQRPALQCCRTPFRRGQRTGTAPLHPCFPLALHHRLLSSSWVSSGGMHNLAFTSHAADVLQNLRHLPQ